MIVLPVEKRKVTHGVVRVRDSRSRPLCVSANPSLRGVSSHPRDSVETIALGEGISVNAALAKGSHRGPWRTSSGAVGRTSRSRRASFICVPDSPAAPGRIEPCSGQSRPGDRGDRRERGRPAPRQSPALYRSQLLHRSRRCPSGAALNMGRCPSGVIVPPVRRAF